VDDNPVQQLTADEFAALVFAATDDQIEEGIRAGGTAQVLDRIFTEMAGRFLADKARDTTAEIQWVITDGDEEHRYAMSIGDGLCAVGRGRADGPAVTLTMDTVSFAKLVTGRREGVQLWMIRKLKVDGDLMLAVRLNGFFQRPRRPE
jgi:putative sterol carrier protein